MVFGLGTEGSKSSLLRNWWFQCFSVMELKVSMVPYLEMMYVTCFSVYELKVPKVPYLGMCGSKVFLFRN